MRIFKKLFKKKPGLEIVNMELNEECELRRLGVIVKPENKNTKIIELIDKLIYIIENLDSPKDMKLVYHNILLRSVATLEQLLDVSVYGEDVKDDIYKLKELWGIVDGNDINILKLDEWEN